ncbi:MAG: NAD-dependent epimerase/dehydratase family protein [Bacteroidetes bacterium]|nr:NAD-dependent epimerase/dehydratase family protein [Bacteroidota bacterium]
MTVLVTGGAGFIGSNVVDALVGRGHDVHVLDDLSGGFLKNVPAEATLHRHDIRSAEARSVLEQIRPEVLFHFAAQMDVRRSVADPIFDADVNVCGILNLLEGGRNSGLKKVIFASTGGAIYGDPEFVPQSEDHPLRPVSPYGITKLTTEKYLYYYNKQYGIEYIALRYGNIFGPRQNPHGEAGVVAIFCERLLADKQAVIFGSGDQTRDYTFVSDVVAANLAALDSDATGVFNVGTGVETSVNDLFRILRDLSGSDMPEEHAPGRPGEQQRSVLDGSLAKSVLGFSPEYSVREGLAITLDWFRKNRLSS